MSKWNSPEWEALYSGEACPICREGRPAGIVAELNATYLTTSPDSPMRGYCCLVLKRHAVELSDLSADEAAALMKDLQRVAATAGLAPLVQAAALRVLAERQDSRPGVSKKP